MGRGGFALAARLDLGPVDSRDDLVRLVRERRGEVIADLIALASTNLELHSRGDLGRGCHGELDLCDEILHGHGEPLQREVQG